jgi:hypothetical protein
MIKSYLNLNYKDIKLNKFLYMKYLFTL